MVVSASIHVSVDIQPEQLSCQLDHTKKKLEYLDITYYQWYEYHGLKGPQLPITGGGHIKI